MFVAMQLRDYCFAGPETAPEILDPPGEPSPEIRDDPSPWW